MFTRAHRSSSRLNRWILSVTLACIFLGSSTYRDLHIQLAHEHETAVCQDHDTAAHLHAGNEHSESCPLCHYFIPSPVIAPQAVTLSLEQPAQPILQALYLDGILAQRLLRASQRGPPLRA